MVILDVCVCVYSYYSVIAEYCCTVFFVVPPAYYIYILNFLLLRFHL